MASMKRRAKKKIGRGRQLDRSACTVWQLSLSEMPYGRTLPELIPSWNICRSLTQVCEVCDFKHDVVILGMRAFKGGMRKDSDPRGFH